MKTQGTYGPEDLESLLMGKDFKSLYPEEKEFVLKHMEDEQEYADMRDLMLNISSDLMDTETMSPPSDLREKMIAQHKSHHKKPRFTIWLNSVFAMLHIPEHIGRPALQFASVIGIISLAWLFLSKPLDPKLGIEKDKKEGAKPEMVQSEFKSSEPESLMEKANSGLNNTSTSPLEELGEVSIDHLDKESPFPAIKSEKMEKTMPLEMDSEALSEMIIADDEVQNDASDELKKETDLELGRNIAASESAPAVSAVSKASSALSLQASSIADESVKDTFKSFDKTAILPDTDVNDEMISLLSTTW